ncbi:hypothetical protein RhiirA4_458229 [Rhizophagus irregularis]|uniref:Uncharacterized protein n=1 Tax=Rhizophagus irregularis TaxID=588596 RepID=A0A2I1GBQ4_9GLOM|nr:hypothetical protein RhiirA4_458229 [Rhizophagus irregularis]
MQSTSDFQQQQQEKISQIRRPGIFANFIYKIVELATYTSAFATDAINILSENTLNTGGHSTRRNYGYDDINDDENVETVDEELPPPYATTFATTTTTTTETKPSLTIDYPTIQTSQKISTPTHSPTNSTSRRRKFRVRRGRRIIRRKSSSIDMNIIKNTDTHTDNNVDHDVDSFNTDSHTDNNFDDDVDTDNNVDDDVDIIYERLNSKISDMIAEGEAALISKVEITEVDMILAEEKEYEERIMKEFGIQTPLRRRARANFNVHNYNYNYNF